ncbi:MAG: hypothetical protein IJ690_03850 [Clostridia bacterium]|nr:hypothetical protein [Clostridia bacterium]
MTLEEDLINEIKEIVNTKTKNRNKILSLVIRDDETKSILKLYAARKTPAQIAHELSIDSMRVEERMHFIDSISRIIDSQISSITIKKYKDKQSEKMARGEEISTTKRKNSTRREFLDKYKRLYREGKIDSAKFEKDIPTLKELINQLNNRPRDIMFMVEVLVSLNKLQDAEDALNTCLEQKNISEADRLVLQANRNYLLKQRSKKMITDLFEKGMTGDEIANYIENNWGREYIRILDRNFIYKTITDYYGSQKDEKNK